MTFIKDIIIEYLPVPANNSTNWLAEVESVLTGIYGRTPVRAASPHDHADGDSLSLVTQPSHRVGP